MRDFLWSNSKIFELIQLGTNHDKIQWSASLVYTAWEWNTYNYYVAFVQGREALYSSAQIRENLYKSDIQVVYRFRIVNKSKVLSIILHSGFQSSSLKSPSKAVDGKFNGTDGLSKRNKNEPICTYLGHCKLSWFLPLV